MLEKISHFFMACEHKQKEAVLANEQKVRGVVGGGVEKNTFKKNTDDFNKGRGLIYWENE